MKNVGRIPRDIVVGATVRVNARLIFESLRDAGMGWDWDSGLQLEPGKRKGV